MSIVALLDRALALRREEVLTRKRALPSVPYMPKASKGWLDLEADIATEFGALGVDWDDFAHAEALRRAALNNRAREWQRLMKACGRCIHCGKPRGKDGTGLRCRTHADLHNAYVRRWAREHKTSVKKTRVRVAEKLGSLGLCFTCMTKPAKVGKRRCGSCATKRVRATKKRRERLNAMGLCRDCTMPRIAGKMRCQRHLDEQRAHCQRWRSKKSAELLRLGKKETVAEYLAKRAPAEVAEDKADFERWQARIAPSVERAMAARAGQVRAAAQREARRSA